METITAMEKCEILKKNIDDISSMELQNYLNSLRHYSQNTIKKFIDQLNHAFKYAQNKGYIMKNPMFDIIKPKSNKQPRDVRALEIEEQQKLTDYLLYVPISDEPFKDAGAHFNPCDCPHPYHKGDLPPLFGANGKAFSMFMTNRFKVCDVIGKTVVTIS